MHFGLKPFFPFNYRYNPHLLDVSLGKQENKAELRFNNVDLLTIGRKTGSKTEYGKLVNRHEIGALAPNKSCPNKPQTAYRLKADRGKRNFIGGNNA